MIGPSSVAPIGNPSLHPPLTSHDIVRGSYVHEISLPGFEDEDDDLGRGIGGLGYDTDLGSWHPDGGSTNGTEMKEYFN